MAAGHSAGESAEAGRLQRARGDPRLGLLPALCTTKTVELLRDPERRRRMSAETRTFAEGWSSRATTLRPVELYRTLIDEGAP